MRYDGTSRHNGSVTNDNPAKNETAVTNPTIVAYHDFIPPPRGESQIKIPGKSMLWS